jgi:hypothetical protein
MSSGPRFAKKLLLAIKPSLRSSTRKTTGWYTQLASQATAFMAAQGPSLRGGGAGLASIPNSPLGDLLFRVRELQSEFGKGHRQSKLVGAVVHLYCGRGDCRQDF